MLFCLLKTIIGWIVLMIVGTNLIGLIVRGLVRTPEMRELEDTIFTTPPRVADEVAKFKRIDIGVTIFFCLLAIVYLYLLFHYWNLGVTFVAFMFMASRLPDLLWEIRTGQKVQRGNMPKGVVYKAASALTWVALPVLWFSLCYVGK
jgi:hypothetical protein